METFNEEYTSKVTKLIEVNNERKLGYEKAAENVDDTELGTLFREYARQSEMFAHELNRFSRKDPADAGTRLVGDLFRGWMDVKASLASNDDIAMLNACETGENAAMNAYEDALSEDLPSEFEDMINKQYFEISNAYDNIVDLKDKYS